MTLSAIIILGNPTHIKTEHAKQYYKDIETYLYELGVDIVTTDPGADYTCPKKADLYIAHSRGVERDRCITDPTIPFVKLGVPEGVIHPEDLAWFENVWSKNRKTTPIKEHFVFFDEQRESVRLAVEQARKKKDSGNKPSFINWLKQ